MYLGILYGILSLSVYITIFVMESRDRSSYNQHNYGLCFIVGTFLNMLLMFAIMIASLIVILNTEPTQTSCQKYPLISVDGKVATLVDSGINILYKNDKGEIVSRLASGVSQSSDGSAYIQKKTFVRSNKWAVGEVENTTYEVFLPATSLSVKSIPQNVEKL